MVTCRRIRWIFKYAVICILQSSSSLYTMRSIWTGIAVHHTIVNDNCRYYRLVFSSVRCPVLFRTSLYYLKVWRSLFSNPHSKCVCWKYTCIIYSICIYVCVCVCVSCGGISQKRYFGSANCWLSVWALSAWHFHESCCFTEMYESPFFPCSLTFHSFCFCSLHPLLSHSLSEVKDRVRGM